MRLSLGVVALGLLAVSQNGCGGGSVSAMDAGGGDGPIPVDTAHPGDFIAADVDGATVRGEFAPTAGTKGVADGEIWLNAGLTSKLDGWLLYIQNSVGTSACSPNWIALFDIGPTLRSDNPGGSCSVTVTVPAPALGDVIEGTFTATLATASTTPTTAAVTNGVFQVTRTNE
jgi:hypothetical protein